jgi:hypothetical protein
LLHAPSELGRQQQSTRQIRFAAINDIFRNFDGRMDGRLRPSCELSLDWGPTMRGFLMLSYCLISILTAGQAMFRSSLWVGISALAASALVLFATESFFGSFLARREKKYSALDLLGIGAIAIALVALAFGLMLWSGFSLSIGGLHIPGPYWVVAGMLTAVLITEKKHSL